MLGWSFTVHTNKAACCSLLIKSRWPLMHLNTHFIFSTFNLSATHSEHFLNIAYKKRKSGPNECSPEWTEALTPNGHVSSAKPLMDDANYQRLGGPHKRSGSICHVVCCTHSKMSSDDSRLKYGNQQEHIVQCDGEYSVLSPFFAAACESKWIPDPWIKAGRGKTKQQHTEVNNGIKASWVKWLHWKVNR